jgi:hypothetical protein
MRYSRFKKQMDGTATKTRTRGPNNPNSPRKNNTTSKISKVVSPRKGQGQRKGKAKEEVEVEDEESQNSGIGGIKPEPGMSSSSRQGTAESEALSERILGRGEKRVKMEPGLLGVTAPRGENQQQSLPTPKTMPGTPSSGRYLREASASPSPGPNSHSDHDDRFEGEMDEMGFSFGMGCEGALPGLPMYASFAGGEFGMGAGFGVGVGVGGMGMQMGMGDMYEGLWQGPGQSGHVGSGHGGSGMREGGVHVKTEPRWEEAYRHV